MTGEMLFIITIIKNHYYKIMKCTYFISYTGIRNTFGEQKHSSKLKLASRVFGNAIIDIDRALDCEDALKEVREHIEKKEKIFEVVIIFFKCLKME